MHSTKNILKERFPTNGQYTKSCCRGVIDRTNKKVYAKIATPNAKGQRLTAKQLIDILKAVSKQENNNTIMTDEFSGYSPLSRNSFVHLRIDHQKAFADVNVHTHEHDRKLLGYAKARYLRHLSPYLC